MSRIPPWLASLASLAWLVSLALDLSGSLVVVGMVVVGRELGRGRVEAGDLERHRWWVVVEWLSGVSVVSALKRSSLSLAND